MKTPEEVLKQLGTRNGCPKGWGCDECGACYDRDFTRTTLVSAVISELEGQKFPIKVVDDVFDVEAENYNNLAENYNSSLDQRINAWKKLL